MKAENRTAIITGASRIKGIGAAICRELADAGFNIFFTYWTKYDEAMPWGIAPEEPMLLKKELSKKGVGVSCMELDLSAADAAEKLYGYVLHESGRPGVLINNAAYSTLTDYSTLTADELDRHYQINIRATTLLSIQFARHFDGKAGGSIVNITSGQALGPMPGELAYAATKGGVDALTLTLSAELAPLGITVNAVNPGPTDTGWMTKELKAELLPKFPFGRIGEPKDAARIVRFLVSPEARWITGQIIHSEGGFMR